MQAPLRMERIIPHIVALGVGRLLITSAKKVGREGGREGGRETEQVKAEIMNNSSSRG